MENKTIELGEICKDIICIVIDNELYVNEDYLEEEV